MIVFALTITGANHPSGSKRRATSESTARLLHGDGAVSWYGDVRRTPSSETPRSTVAIDGWMRDKRRRDPSSERIAFVPLP